MKDETFDTWNKIAEIYQEKFMDLKIYDKSYLEFCELIKVEKAKVLDVGCGPGNITKRLLSFRSDLEILGIDYAPNMIELAAKNNPFANFKTMDCKDLSEFKTSFDAIICGFCLPYLTPTDCKKLIEDSSNLLIPKGILYISFVKGEPEKSAFQVGSNGNRIYFNFHLLNDVSNYLLANNFSILFKYEIDYQNKEKHTVLISRLN
jgi:2-polyprenyl-3-methyl-5-hydroxy-6-metoxy-1,4-benzoquinol methylase